MSSPGSSSKTLREDSEDPRPSSSNNIRRVVNQEPLREQLMKASPLTQQSLNTLDDDIAPAPPHGHDYMPVDPCSHQNSHSQEDSPTRRRSEGVVYGPNQGPQSRPHSLGIIEERLVWGVQQGQSSRQNPSLDLQDRPEQRRQMNRQGGKRSLSQPNLPIKQVHFPTQTRSASWHPDQANQQGESSRQAAHRVSWQPTSSSLPLNIEEEPSGAQALTHELGEIRKGKRPNAVFTARNVN
ncbi:hypothetical protein CC78DRAFT_549840 [Lojkania enalia]|uniref:Uncharacterized protein n=1 Tax=Lojkania enalia TaxID=147567 RepID=A0A9P4JXJ5_9PLEO|nr:hypothetical protein CC78DRAFT_549840 [Didymosphaeria enalia]